jgi:VanZ family protein
MLEARPAGNERANGLLLALYILLVAYASLYPLRGWTLPDDGFKALLEWPGSADISRADICANFLAYLPVGFLMTLRRLSAGHDSLREVGRAALAGLLLSLAMEALQYFLPARSSSLLDVLVNLLGAAAGALVCLWMHGNSRLVLRLCELRAQWCLPEPAANAGLLALGVWMLAQLSPFVPWFDTRWIRRGLRGISLVIEHPGYLDPVIALIHAGGIAGLGLLALTLARPGRRVVPLFAFAATATLLLKIVVAGRTLSAEALAGLVLGLAIVALPARLSALPRPWLARLSALAVGGAFVASELVPARGARHAFNWIPFAGQIRSNIDGFASILGSLWPFIALAYLACVLTPSRAWRQVRDAGAIVVAGLTAVLEGVQTLIPGRYGDITTVLLALAGWLGAWHCVLAAGMTVPSTRMPAR